MPIEPEKLKEKPAVPINLEEWNNKSPDLLETLLSQKKYGDADKLLNLLLGDLDVYGQKVDKDVASKVAGNLRKYAWFPKLKEVSESFYKNAQDDPSVLLQVAQSRIELGEITSAIDLLLDLKLRLKDLVEDNSLDPFVRAEMNLEEKMSETLGRLGRCYKQFYINSKPSLKEPRIADLDRSLEYYKEGYQLVGGDWLWHGVNIIALLTHSERIKQDKYNATSPEAETIAKKIIEYVSQKDELDYWGYSYLIESHLALGHNKKAAEYIEKSLDVGNAFQVQSTKRQLKELWLMDESRPPGNMILPIMEARFAELGGGLKKLKIDFQEIKKYERIWGHTTYKSMGWLQQAFERAKCVVRIGPTKYDGEGTGFLFDGSWISNKYKDKKLILTNAHVCSTEEVQKIYPSTALPDEIVATFMGVDDPAKSTEIKFKDIIWTSPPNNLDATLIEVESIPDGSNPPPLSSRKPIVTAKGDARVNILGHPHGFDLRISLQDNNIVNSGEKYFHYRTPTDPGSSGSPVFNQKWQLVGLHHASSSIHRANEGVRMDIIIETMKKELL